MKVLNKSKVIDFIASHADARIALQRWVSRLEDGNWKSLADFKPLFKPVDNVGNDHYVFNIKGNKYRIVAILLFQVQIVNIRFIGTHADYSKIGQSEISNL